jgi:hypothetical protein
MKNKLETIYIIPLYKLINFHSNLSRINADIQKQLTAQKGPVVQLMSVDKRKDLADQVEINEKMLESITLLFRNRAVELTKSELEPLLGDVTEQIIKEGVKKGRKVYL